MAQTTVTTSQLRSAAQRLEEIIGRYTVSYTNLQSQSQNLSQMWEGEASQKFINKLNADMPKFKNMETVLKGYQSALLQEAQTYDQAEENAKSALQG